MRNRIRNTLLLLMTAIFLTAGWLAQSRTLSAIDGSKATSLLDQVGVPALINDLTEIRASAQEAAILTVVAPRAYVTNRFTNNVSVIDTGTDTLVTNITVGPTPYGIAIAPSSRRLYVTNQGSNSVSVIRTATNRVVANISVGSSPIAVAVTPDGTRAYVVNQVSNNVSVIDTATNTVIGSPIPVGISPEGIAIGTTANGVRPC